MLALIGGMETLATHYARLLRTDDSWRVEAVDQRHEDHRVEIRLKHLGPGVAYPECGRNCGLADHADERRWRHLDTMQFTTELVARLPRCRCPEHGVKTIVHVVQDRTQVAAEAVLQTLTPEQRRKVRAVAADMLPAYSNAVAKQTPNAELVHDRFHVGKYIGEAVDQVRRAENKDLQAEDDDRLKGTRQLWLFN